MKTTLLSLALGLITTTAFTQNLGLDWAVQMGGTDSDIGYSITTDAAGNIYTTGGFSGTADFDPGAGTMNLTSNGSADIFVQKLDKNGDFLWARQMGGTNLDRGESITTDASGNVYITGFFQRTVDFDPGAGTMNLTSNGGWDIFVQKLDANGDFLWARHMGGSSNGGDVGESITTDVAGNVYTTGYFVGTVDFDPGAGTMNFTSAGNSDMFIQKLDANGDFMWVRQMGGSSDDRGYSIITDTAGNVYSTGFFSRTVDFDPGAGTMNLTSNGFGDIFIQKLDVNGDFLWAGQMGGTGNDMGSSITTDTAGNVYTTGDFRATVDFDPGAGTMNLTSNGDIDVFIQKLDGNGDFLWARHMGGTGFTQGSSITTDATGNVYTTGYFAGTVDFDPGAGTMNFTSAGDEDIFVQKLGDNGGFLWAGQMGGPDLDQGHSITTDAAGNVYTTGFFNGTADFDPGAGAINLTSAGISDIFIQQLSYTSVGITDNSIFNQVSIYPNPAQSRVNIELGQLADVSIIITNATGKVLHQKSQINAGISSIELKESAGLYFVEIISNDKRQWYKLIKL